LRTQEHNKLQDCLAQLATDKCTYPVYLSIRLCELHSLRILGGQLTTNSKLAFKKCSFPLAVSWEPSTKAFAPNTPELSILLDNVQEAEEEDFLATALVSMAISPALLNLLGDWHGFGSEADVEAKVIIEMWMDTYAEAANSGKLSTLPPQILEGLSRANCLLKAVICLIYPTWNQWGSTCDDLKRVLNHSKQDNSLEARLRALFVQPDTDIAASLVEYLKLAKTGLAPAHQSKAEKWQRQWMQEDLAVDKDKLMLEVMNEYPSMRQTMRDGFCPDLDNMFEEWIERRALNLAEGQSQSSLEDQKTFTRGLKAAMAVPARWSKAQVALMTQAIDTVANSTHTCLLDQKIEVSVQFFNEHSAEQLVIKESVKDALKHAQVIEDNKGSIKKGDVPYETLRGWFLNGQLETAKLAPKPDKRQDQDPSILAQDVISVLTRLSTLVLQEEEQAYYKGWTDLAKLLIECKQACYACKIQLAGGYAKARPVKDVPDECLDTLINTMAAFNKTLASMQASKQIPENGLWAEEVKIYVQQLVEFRKYLVHLLQVHQQQDTKTLNKKLESLRKYAPAKDGALCWRMVLAQRVSSKTYEEFNALPKHEKDDVLDRISLDEELLSGITNETLMKLSEKKMGKYEQELSQASHMFRKAHNIFCASSCLSPRNATTQVPGLCSTQPSLHRTPSPMLTPVHCKCVSRSQTCASQSWAIRYESIIC